MPWEIRRNYGGCSGYAVVKLPDGSVSGCHSSRAEARSQLAALYASEPEAAQKEVITSLVTPNKYPQSMGPRKKKVKKEMDLYDMLNPEEQAYHDALVEIVEEFGYFDQEASSIWVGYESAAENEDAAIGVKCGNCSFHYEKSEGGLGCMIVSFEVEENGKCRLAAIPDGLVNVEMAMPTMNRNEQQEFVNDMMERIGKADSVRVGQMVSWNSSGGRATGKVIRIIRNGKYNVPDSDFTITGTPDDPAVAIRVYRDGEPTDRIVGHKMGTLRRVGKSMNQDIEEAKAILESIEKGYGKDKKKSMHEDDMDEDMDDWEKRDYTPSQRRAMARRGQAMEDGSFPIANRTDLGNAIQSVGRAANYDAARRHIIGRARALGAVEMLPEDWNVKKGVSSLFQNLPSHAKRVNTTGNAKINLNLFKGQ